MEECKVITSSKTFLTNHLYSENLKEENGIFYAREFSTENWQELKGIYATPFNKFIDICYLSSSPFFSLIIPICFLIGLFLLFPLWFFPPIIKLSDKKIRDIIADNSESFKNRKINWNNHRGNSIHGSNIDISSSDLDKALKKFKSVGKDWGELVNDTTDEDRKKLFTEYFKDANKGEAANNKFIREQAWPAREHTLKKILEESDYEDLETKEKFEKQIENLSGKISNSDFQKIATEIREYQERKRLKDNHIKFEGRLSNNDVQKIKDYLGYVCMGCGLNPVKEYGEQMKGILEAHHKRPWGELQEDEVRTVTPNDFYILCPNCHRIIHKLSSPDDIDKLREILRYHKAHK